MLPFGNGLAMFRLVFPVYHIDKIEAIFGRERGQALFENKK
jgi:hypothetical protein